MKIDKFEGEYAFLSNFYEAPVVFDGVRYENSEAAFQAQKCETYEERRTFSKENPAQAKKHGRRVILRKDWEEVKIQLMKEIVTEKFRQNPELLRKLTETGDAYLEEGNYWNDRVWGVCNGSGANNLGRILMEVREELREPGLEK